MRTPFIVLFFSVFLLGPFFSGTSYGQQPSFNCMKATRSDEATICGNSELASFDRQLQGLYEAVRDAVAPGDRIFLRDTQRFWLQKRNACGTSVNCIAGLYRSRISELKILLAGPITTPPPVATRPPTTTRPESTPPTSSEPRPTDGRTKDACDAFPTLC